MITIGTTKKEKNEKTVDHWSTLDKRIADGFYFAKSIKLIEYIAIYPELLEQRLNTKIEDF